MSEPERNETGRNETARPGVVPDVVPDLVLDLRGARCPVPVLKLEAALRRAAPGDRITLLSDDPIARVDVPYAVSSRGHVLKETERTGETVRFTVIASGDAATR